jgi:hypothetical protein
MTKDGYAKEVWKVVSAIHDGEKHIMCPHEDCERELTVFMASLHAGTAFVCPTHGVVYRE